MSEPEQRRPEVGRRECRTNPVRYSGLFRRGLMVLIPPLNPAALLRGIASFQPSGRERPLNSLAGGDDPFRSPAVERPGRSRLRHNDVSALLLNRAPVRLATAGASEE